MVAAERGDRSPCPGIDRIHPGDGDRAPRARQHRPRGVEQGRGWQAGGVGGLWYLPGADLLGTDGEGAVDASHPNDLGFMRQADAFEPVLRAALDAAAR
jgi:hypothetical protein